MEIGAFDNPKINKKILFAGRDYKPIGNGTRVYFHFTTRKCNDDRTVIDDSRKMGKPMELVIGKKFKLEVWETIVQAMAVSEVASFVVDKSLLYAYPVVSKTLREAAIPNRSNENVRTHTCAHSLHSLGLGYADLDELMKSPSDLEFIIELLKVENDGEYERESWQLTEKDKMRAVPVLREEGNQLFKEGKIEEAAMKYSMAIGYLDQLMLCEKPGDIEWTKLNDQKLPLLLNYSQCKLSQKDYYAVIEHCSTVLQYQPDNVKALYRRGRAHAAVWNMNEARSDLMEVSRLDPTLSNTAVNLIKQLEITAKEKESSLKDNIKGKLF